MTIRRWTALALAATLVGWAATCPPASAQEPSETPEAFAQRFAEVTKSGDWDAFADLMHPQALSTFKELFTDMAGLVDGAEMLEPMFGVDTSEEFEELPGSQVFVRVMESLEKLVPGFAEALAESNMDVVGSVADDDGVVHVVYKMQMTVEDVGLSRTSVVSLRRHGDQWRALLTGNVEGMARSLAEVMVVSPALPPALQDDAEDSADSSDDDAAEAS